MLKILIIVPGMTGVSYHRQIIPHQYLGLDPEFEITQIDQIDDAEDDFLKQFQIVQFNKLISIFGNHSYILDKLHRLGIVTVCDIDDYWILSKSHPKYDYYKDNFMADQVLSCIRESKQITTTTEYFAKTLRDINKNVTVIPNAIDPDQPNYEIAKTESEYLRFGWIGSLSHAEDIAMMAPSFEMLNHSKAIFGSYIMGYNDQDEGFYDWCEKIFRKGEKPGEQRFFRINSTDVNTYAQGYNLFDVSLAPLKHGIFNSFRSELKMIEAGFMKKAIIVSKGTPYLHLITPRNCVAVQEQAKFGWYNAVRYLIANPYMVEDLAEQLYEDVQKYHIKVVNEIRKELYKEIVK